MKLRDNNPNKINVLTRKDITYSNEIRREMIANGADTYDVFQLNYNKEALDKVNNWLNDQGTRGEMSRIAAILLLTLHDSDWNKIIETKSPNTVNNILNRHMNKDTAYSGRTLWDMVHVNMTSSQIASGLALDEWDTDTKTAFFKAEETISIKVIAHRM